MHFSKKRIVEILKFRDLWALVKRGNFVFFQSVNFEPSSGTGFEPGTFRVTAGSLIYYTKFPYGKKVKKKLMQILIDLCNLFEAESPVESKNNQLTFDLDKIFAWNFKDVWESKISNLCHLRLVWESCFVKKWITLVCTKGIYSVNCTS